MSKARCRHDHERGRLGLLALLILVFFAGCAAKPGMEDLVPAPVSHPQARQVTIFIVTNREAVDPRGLAYGTGRGVLRYEEMTLSVPPDHRAGQIEWAASDARDPAKSFVVVRREQLDERAFVRRVAERQGGGGMAGIFVPGFNQSFQKSVFRAAQLAADVDSVSAPILFSWPSEGKVTGYVADRDATAFARDDLAHVLTLLHRAPAGRRIGLVGHSMGGWLIMETLRQLRLAGKDAVIARYEVALAAPDIDMDVFRRQFAVIGRLDPPLSVLVSADDRALAISRRVAGGHQRLGSIDVQDPRLQEIARRENLRIIDIAALDASDGARHDRFVNFIALQGGELTDGRSAGGSVRQAGAFIFDAAGAAIASPFTLAGRVFAGE